MHGQVIDYKNIDKYIRNRDEYINLDPLITKKLKKGEPLLFMPTYLLEDSKRFSPDKRKPKYKIILVGILQDGREMNVVIDDILPYYEILIRETDRAKIKSRITEIKDLLESSDLNIKPIKYEENYAKPFKYYNKNNYPFLKCYYNNLAQRKYSIEFIHKNQYETATDDKSSYYRTVCRDKLLSFSTWVELHNYRIEDVSYLKGKTLVLGINDYRKYNGELTSELMKDKSVCCSWDIETWSPTGELPIPDNPADKIFVIGMVFNRVYEKQPFLKICLTELNAAPHPEYLTIVCGNESNIISSYGKIMAKLRPNFIIGFNDSEYDCPWLVKRASQKGLLEELAKNMDITCSYKYKDEKILQFNFKNERIKIDAENAVYGDFFMLPGYIPIDVRISYRQLYSKSEFSSLKFFLEENKLNSKEDMPIPRLFKIYTEYKNFIDKHGKDSRQYPAEILDEYNTHKKNMSEVNYYCLIDSQRCHELMACRNVFMDRRELANMAYVSLYDGVFRADGMKVRNLTIAIGQNAPFNIRFSSVIEKSDDVGKYPGAYVFPPEKGVKTSKLSLEERIKYAKSNIDNIHDDWLETTEEELNKFYSIIEKYGACIKEEEISNVEKVENTKLPSKFVKFMTEINCRPILGLDFSSLYPSLIRTYNFSPEKCILDEMFAKEMQAAGKTIIKVDFLLGENRKIGYFIWHKCKYDINDKDFEFGLYPYILDDLFNKRVMMKKSLKELNHKLEKIRILSDEEKAARKEEIDGLILMQGYVNAKQNALKVFMNTFYGETGNASSPFRVIEVAGGITSYGIQNLKFAHKYVLEKNCHVVYGDTDSLYLWLDQKLFHDLDIQYYTGKMSKLDYWTESVKTTFKNIEIIREGVNAAFEKDNGTKFLSMAYEEVLFPSIFFAKKKYLGIQHEKIPNFNVSYDDFFVKGLESKKKGVSKLLKIVTMNIIEQVLSINNLMSMFTVATRMIDSVYEKKWDLENFIQSGVYKPSKKNIKLHTFVRRMKERNVEVKPNERFQYIVTKKYPYKFNLRGCQEKLSVGDKIEFVETVEKENLPIDIDYYMKGSINGQLARFISYHNMFYVKPDQSDKEGKIAEKKIYENACKYVEQYCKKYYGFSKSMGKEYKKIFTNANKIVKSIKHADYTSLDILTSNVKYDNFDSWLLEKAKKFNAKKLKEYGEDYVNKILCDKMKEIKIKYKLLYEDKKIAIASANKEYRTERNKIINLLQKMYCGENKYRKSNSIYEITLKKYNIAIGRIKADIKNSYADLTKIFQLFNKGIETLTESLKLKIIANQDIDDLFSDDTNNQLTQMAKDYYGELYQNPEVIKGIKYIRLMYMELIANNRYLSQVESIIEYLKILRDRYNNYVEKPANFDISNNILSPDLLNNLKL